MRLDRWWGVVPKKECCSLFMYYISVSSAGGRSISKVHVGSIPFVVHNASDGSRELLRSGTSPCLFTCTSCPPNVTAHDQISQAFPYVFAYCKQSSTGGGNGLGTRLRWRYIMEVVLVHLYSSFGACPAWEQGYVVHSTIVQRRLKASN